MQELFNNTSWTRYRAPVIFSTHTNRIRFTAFCYTIHHNLFTIFTAKQSLRRSTGLASIVIRVGNKITTIANINQSRESQIFPTNSICNRTCPLRHHITDNLTRFTQRHTVIPNNNFTFIITFIRITHDVTIVTTFINNY